MADLKAFAEQLVNLTVKEVNELATILKEEYGIEPAAAREISLYGWVKQSFIVTSPMSECTNLSSPYSILLVLIR